MVAVSGEKDGGAMARVAGAHGLESRVAGFPRGQGKNVEELVEVLTVGLAAAVDGGEAAFDGELRRRSFGRGEEKVW